MADSDLVLGLATIGLLGATAVLAYFTRELVLQTNALAWQTYAQLRILTTQEIARLYRVLINEEPGKDMKSFVEEMEKIGVEENMVIIRQIRQLEKSLEQQPRSDRAKPT